MLITGLWGESSGLPALLDEVDPIKEFCMLILRLCCATVLWWIGAIAVPLVVQSITLNKEAQYLHLFFITFGG